MNTKGHGKGVFSKLSANASKGEGITCIDDAFPSKVVRCNTTVWVRYFEIKAYAGCDSRGTGFDGSSHNRVKKFHSITREIFLLNAGLKALNMACAALLREICREYQGPRPITLEELVRLFCLDYQIGTMWHELVAGNTSSLLLVTTNWESSGNMVCKLESSRRKPSTRGRFIPKFSNANGAGTGYGAASNMLSNLSNNATEDEVKAVVRAAFQKASEEDDRTGGTLLLFGGSSSLPWALVDHDKLRGKPTKNKI